MPSKIIIPAELQFEGNHVFSPVFDDIYQSREGAEAQAQTVFLDGSNAQSRWQNAPSYAILETGFGTGLNFLVTWHAWRHHPERSRQLHFISYELHPFSAADLRLIAHNYPDLLDEFQALIHAWPDLTPGWHRLHFDQDQVILTLFFGDMLQALPLTRAAIDSFYLDGFAPSKNPEPWSRPVIRQLARLATLGATLSTWCVAGELRKHLIEAGFLPQRLPGFGRKKQRLFAEFRPAWSRPIQVRGTLPQTAIVIGAGIAGVSIAERLAARGIRVTLLEAHTAGSGASGNPAACFHPILAADASIGGNGFAVRG